GGGMDCWDQQDGFFYDVIHLPSGRNIPLKIHSMVGLTPLIGVHVIEPAATDGLDRFVARTQAFLEQRPSLLRNVAPVGVPGRQERVLLAILPAERLRSLLRRILDPRQFPSP